MLFLKKNDKELINISLSNLQGVLVRDKTRMIFSKESVDLGAVFEVNDVLIFLKTLESKFDIITLAEFDEQAAEFFGKGETDDNM